jgi:thioredoxin 1
MEKLTGSNFEEVVSSQEGLFVIKFSSPTCGPCGTMKPVFKALDDNNPSLNVFEVDTSESPELASHFGVRGVPYVTFCENREVLYDFTGVTPLADLQFVVDNIDDPHFRETGQFQVQESNEKKNWWFEITLGTGILIYVLVMILT